MDKDDVKKKIIFYCNKHKIPIPILWNYKTIKNIADIINILEDKEQWKQDVKRMRINEFNRTCGYSGEDYLNN